MEKVDLTYYEIRESKCSDCILELQNLRVDAGSDPISAVDAIREVPCVLMHAGEEDDEHTFLCIKHIMRAAGELLACSLK